jgi:hypothetical protein
MAAIFAATIVESASGTAAIGVDAICAGAIEAAAVDMTAVAATTQSVSGMGARVPSAVEASGACAPAARVGRFERA